MITKKTVSVRQVGFALADRLDLRTCKLYPGDEFLQEFKQVRSFFVTYLYFFVDHDAQKYGFIVNYRIYLNRVVSRAYKIPEEIVYLPGICFLIGIAMSFKKIIYIIIIAVAFIVLAIFIAQNNQQVSIRFMKWHYDSQSGLIVLFSFIIGMFVGFLMWIISLIFRKRPVSKKELPDQPIDAPAPEEPASGERENFSGI